MQPLTFGLGPGNVIKPLLLDALGNVLASVPMPTAVGMGFTLDAGGNLQVAGYGGNVLLGYYDRSLNKYENTDLPAGITTYDWPAVPAGKVYIVTSVSFNYTGTVTNVSLNLSIVSEGIEYLFWKTTAPVSGRSYPSPFEIAMKEGDNMRFQVRGATVHDDCSATWFATIILVP